MSIAERLKEDRKRLKLSQSDFGALGGAGKTTVIAWERGDATPNAAFLEAAASAGADVRYIVTGYREGPPPLVLSADEQELLALFRSASLSVKAAAIGALQGGSSPLQKAPRYTVQQTIQGNVGQQASGNIVNKGKK